MPDHTPGPSPEVRAAVRALDDTDLAAVRDMLVNHTPPPGLGLEDGYRNALQAVTDEITDRGRTTVLPLHVSHLADDGDPDSTACGEPRPAAP